MTYGNRSVTVALLGMLMAVTATSPNAQPRIGVEHAGHVAGRFGQRHLGGRADLIFFNATVLTMERPRPLAQAVAVKGDGRRLPILLIPRTGKLADLVVLSASPAAVPSSLIKDIEVLMTMVGGKVEHCLEGYESVCKSSFAPTHEPPWHH